MNGNTVANIRAREVAGFRSDERESARALVARVGFRVKTTPSSARARVFARETDEMFFVRPHAAEANQRNQGFLAHCAQKGCEEREN